MAINLNDNIRVLANKPVEERYLYNFNPYSSTGETISVITSDRRYVGLTVNVNGVEYWFQSGIGDNDLVLKGIGSGGLNNAINGLFYTGATVELGGTLIKNTEINLDDNQLIITGNSGTSAVILNNLKYLDGNEGINKVLVSDSGGTAYWLETVEADIITGATNGITKDGDVVKLGGALTELTMITDVRTGVTKTGIEYGGDYSATFVDRSLVDKKYVDNKISSGGTITGGTNGLSVNGKDIELGGTVIKNTEINLDDNQLIITGNSGTSAVILNNLKYLDGNEFEGSVLASDSGGTAYWAETIESELITGATNGLTKIGDVVTLGGELFNNTIIEDNFNGRGIQYAADYSATFINRSLVDKEYVDNKIVGSGTTSGEYNNKYINQIITTAETLTTGSSYVVLVNHVAPVTVTLPLTPFNGEAFKFKDISGNALVNNITIHGNGVNIDNALTALIDSDYGAVEVMYNITQNQWYTLSFIV